MIRRLLLPSLLAGAALAAAAAPALADTTVSSNWSGYAVHGTSKHYRTVTGRWRIPTPACRATPGTASAMWIGIGGYSGTSGGLEQIGTEVDCSTRGRAEYSAWSEILPAASNTLRLAVRPGNLMQATVTVVGHRVTLSLANLTTHRAVTHTQTATTIDTSSAEWILEAPSQCTTSGLCATMPLADFVKAQFSSARTTTQRGVTGTIKNANWQATAIALSPGHRRFVTQGSAASASGSATPSPLSAGGSAFTVTYGAASNPSGVYFTGRLYHPQN